MGSSADANEPGGEFWAAPDDEAALQRFRTLAGTIDDGLYQLDDRGRFVAVNDAIVETTGHAREDLLGAHVSAILADDDVAAVEAAIGDALAGDGAPDDDALPTFELAVRTAAGGRVPCEVRVNPLVEDGEFRGTIGVARRLSGRRRRLRTVEPSDVPYESVAGVLDESDVGVFVYDENAEVAWANEATERYFGIDRVAVVGTDKRRLIEETVKQRMAEPEAFAETVLATDDSTSVERFECRLTGEDDGEGRWLEHYSRPIESGRHAGGRLELYYDVTDREESERGRRDAKEQFRSLVDAVEEYAIFRLDADGNVTTWNEGARAIKGYDADEILGEHFSTFYTDADRAADVPARNLREATTNGSVEDEGWRVRQDGTRFWANVTITAVRDDDGIHRGYLKVTRDMTDRYEREQELENELQRVFGRISDGFFAVGEDWEITHVNERAEESLGVEGDEVIGQSVWSAFPDLVDTEFESRYRTAMASQEPTSFEAYYPPSDAWFEAHVYPSETGLSIYFRDTTDRVERTRELERTERRFEAVFNDPNILVGLLEPDGTVLDINQTAMEYVDDDLEAVTGEPFWETPWWGEGDAVQPEVKEWTERAAAGEYVEFEQDLTRPDGERYTLSGYFRPVTNDDGEVVSIIVSDRDVTERKRREQALQESKNQLQALIDVLPVAVFVAEDDGEIVEWNEAAEEIWGGEVAESESVAEYDRYEAWWAATGEPVEPAEWPLARALEGEEVTDPDEIVIKGFDGETRTVLNHGMPVRDADGEVSRAVVTLVDISELKEYERRLEESNDRLEQFAYAASHDLQEPLRMVSSYLQLIENRYADELDADGEEFLEFAVDGAERMRDMIEALLEYSRIETRGDPFEPVDLADVVADVSEDLQFRIEEADATIDAGDLARVEGDPSQLRQVFQNLLDNAIEYRGEKPPRIEVTTEPTAGGDRVSVAVSDDGIGIDPDDQERVFQVFERLHTRDEHAGTGIGLAVCRRIVERHGGDIRVESEPGEGTTFVFTLPAAE